ncbi:MAG: tripartite tricarboxylate transporter substrate binding protein [Proteobacteria bacterium]|nr:tripartite tricarboxylate transporter substrate binding protein [Burkholderiales bacterium]
MKFGTKSVTLDTPRRRLLAALAGTPFAALAQGPPSYPTRPITLLCWSAPGSPVDIYSRIMAKLLSNELGQSVVVENRTGANGIIMINALIKAPANGYTIAAATTTLATLFSEPNAGFKVDDLQMIARSQLDPYALLVHASTPFRTIDEFVGFARRKPEFISVGGPFNIGAHRVAWELFAEAAKIRTTWIPYPGGGPALAAIAGGQVDAVATNPGIAKPFVNTGKVRVLAVSSERRLDDFPEVPTYRERGWDIVRYQWRGMITRAGTPRPIVERLAAALQRAQQGVEWKAYLRQETQLDGFQGPDDLRAQLLQDVQEMERTKSRLGLT